MHHYEQHGVSTDYIATQVELMQQVVLRNAPVLKLCQRCKNVTRPCVIQVIDDYAVVSAGFGGLAT